MVAPSRHRYTLQDDLAVEEMSAVRHEYLDGEVFAMAGGTPEHAALSAAALVLLGERLRGGPCRPSSSDLRIRIVATGLATYPDAAVICGESVRDATSPTHVTNPSIIVEVLSPGTSDYDRGEKREHDQQIVSLRDYVLVAQDRREVEVFARTDAGWVHEIHRGGDMVTLTAAAVRFTVDELYDAAGLSSP